MNVKPHSMWSTLVIAMLLTGCAVGVDETSAIESGNWAANDALSVSRDEAGTTSDVRSNDNPPDKKNALKISGWTDGSKGAVEYNGDGTFTYTPDPNIDSGGDSFTYTAVDGKGNFSTATVSVTVAAGWGRAVEMSTHYYTGGYSRVTDDNDNTTVVWAETDGTRYNLWAKRYTALTKTWSAAQKIDSSDDDAGQAIGFGIVVDSTTDPATTGGVTVVWYQSVDATGTRYDMWGNHFTVSTNTWGTATKIETEDLGSPSAPIVVADSSGNATAIWYQYDGARYNIWSNRFSSAGTWGTATKLDTEDLGDATLSSNMVVVDDSGNVTVVWPQYDGTRYNLWGNRESSTGTWQTATKIENDDTGAGYIGTIKLLVDTANTVNVIYPQYDGTRYNLWANRLTSSTTFNGTTLTTAIKIDSEDLGEAYTYAAVLDETSKNVSVVWVQYNGTVYNMWANRYRVNVSSWGTATKIETDDTGSVSSPVVIIDSSANVTAVWTQSDGTRNNLWANRLGSGQNFNGTAVAASKIETEDAGSALTPKLLVDGSGNVSAIWYQYDGARYNAWANRYNNTTSSWGTAAKIETDDTGTVATTTPVTVIDDAGNVTAAWYQNDGVRYNVWANHMTSAGVWGTATKLDTEDLGSADSPAITVTSAGVVDVVWRQSNSEYYDLWTSRYTGGAWTTADRLTTGLTRGSASLIELFNTEADVPTLIARTYNGVAYSLWVSDFR